MGTDIAALNRERPHLVIVGAGATIATIPDGDKYGRKASVMNDFIKQIGLEDLFADIKLETKSNNIEDIYTELHEKPQYKDLRVTLEERIHRYFSGLKLPDTPTIYDLLVLSLRKKDCIAIFNWDDLILQAYNRVNKITKDLPHLAFLHGCVSVGYHEDCQEYGALRNHCPKCGRYYTPTKLLYPVRHKNYNSDFCMRAQWGIFEYFVASSALITVFGYSAPPSDVEASNIMLKALSQIFESDRLLDHLEIIERPGFTHDNLSSTFNQFSEKMHNHISIKESFFESTLANFPRRTVENYTDTNVSGNWDIESNCVFTKDITSFEQLKQNVSRLLEEE